jgi:hypothetical protein
MVSRRRRQFPSAFWRCAEAPPPPRVVAVVPHCRGWWDAGELEGVGSALVPASGWKVVVMVRARVRATEPA